jgi:DNA mismatch repair protein MutS2
LTYFKKFDDYYPHLNSRASQVELTKDIISSVDAIVDKYGEIDNASPDLLNTRRDINSVRGKVNQSFGVSMTQYNSLGYLDDIKESFVQNRRVLAPCTVVKSKDLYWEVQKQEVSRISNPRPR